MTEELNSFLEEFVVHWIADTNFVVVPFTSYYLGFWFQNGPFHKTKTLGMCANKFKFYYYNEFRIIWLNCFSVWMKIYV
jgi:hypothetical protein